MLISGITIQECLHINATILHYNLEQQLLLILIVLINLLNLILKVDLISLLHQPQVLNLRHQRINSGVLLLGLVLQLLLGHIHI